MTMTQSIDRQTFLANVRLSGLMTDLDLASARPQLPDTNRGRLIARSLVELGLLTRFQAERLLIGRTSGFILGQYKILDQLGRGGMGRVFKAEHQTMKRVVALKVLAPEVIQTARAQELFLREVRVVARLTHPNIVTAYDANEVQGRYFLVLEYIDGPNLEQLVRTRAADNRGPVSVGLACDYMCQAAQALQCAHTVGMVHRDLKPANLLVQRRGFSDDSPGLLKISDFGLARLQEPNINPAVSHGVGTILTRANTVMGTPDFLSPEQARSLHTTDIRSDVYSLGCTFYYLLTGRVPFPGGTTLEKLIRHNAEQPAPVTQFRGDVPASVLEILDKMMAKRPADRYQTPAELAAALEPYAVSGPIPWAPPPAPVSLPDGPPAPGEPNPNSSDELLALTNTLPPGNSPTPIETAHVGSRKVRTKPRKGIKGRRARWLWMALAAILSMGLGVGVLTVILRNL
jgi:eukaryotic-like serine/threonine-protein kinase